MSKRLGFNPGPGPGPPHRAHNNTTHMLYKTKTQKIHTDKHK